MTIHQIAMTGETEVENEIKWLVSFLQDAGMEPDYPCEFSVAKQEKEGKLSKRFQVRNAQSSQCWFWKWMEPKARDYSGFSAGASFASEPVPRLQSREQLGTRLVLLSEFNLWLFVAVAIKWIQMPQAIEFVPLGSFRGSSFSLRVRKPLS